MTRWPYAITCALLALVLSGCACWPHLGMTAVGVAASVATGDPFHAASMGVEAGGCLVTEARKKP